MATTDAGLKTAIEYLAATYRNQVKDWTPVEAQIRYDGLRRATDDLPDRAIMDGVHMHIRSSVYFPSPADLRNAAIATMPFWCQHDLQQTDHYWTKQDYDRYKSEQDTYLQSVSIHASRMRGDLGMVVEEIKRNEHSHGA